MRREIGVLGPLVVVADGAPVEVSGTKQRLLLFLLAAEVGHPVSTDRLIEAMWGDDATERTSHALQAQVSRLRGALAPFGEDLLATSDAGYQLAVDGDVVDARRFESLVARARQEIDDDADEAVATLGEALELWRGRPFGDLGDNHALAAEAARLERLRRTARDLHADTSLALGRHDEVMPTLEQQVEDEPLDEGGWRRLMLARYRAGRQSDALEAYHDLAELLRDELGVDPSPDVQRLHRQILEQDEALAPLDRSHDPTGSSDRRGPVELPRPLGSFVGRQESLARAADLLDGERLVTCVGPGGAGKTRLAIEVARGNLERWPDGVWFIDLAPMEEEGLVADAVATTLGVLGQSNRPALEMAAEALTGRRALLLLDNCEHVLEAVTRTVRRLLADCDALQVLATSRIPLGMPGERAHPVPPLDLPAEDSGQDPAALRASESVRLFVDRAQGADPSFSLTEATAPVVARICRRLDGIPLAIELAAARIRALPPDALDEQIGRDPRILSGGDPSAHDRQRTLHALVGWSHDLLDDEQQAVFHRLGAFAAPFTLEAAEAVAGDDDVDVVAAVADLVDHSLVMRDRDEGRRYRLLDTVRSYAREQLRVREERTAVRDAHLEWAGVRVRQVQAGFDGPEQMTWLARLRFELDEFRAAMDWAVESGQKAAGLAIASALYRYWFIRGIREGRHWLDRLMGLPGEVPAPVVAAALFADGSLRELQGHDEDAAEQLATSRQLFHELGATRGAAHAGNVLARARWGRMDPDGLHDLVTTVLDEFRQMNDDAGTAIALMFVVLWEMEYGDPEPAMEASEELLERCEALGSPHLLAHADELWTTAMTLAGSERSPLAADRIQCALQLYLMVRSERCGAHGLTSAGWWLAEVGRPEVAAVLQGAAEGTRDRLGAAPPRYEHPMGFDKVERVAALPPEIWEQRLAEGRSLTFEEAVERGRAAIRDAMEDLALTG